MKVDYSTVYSRYIDFNHQVEVYKRLQTISRYLDVLSDQICKFYFDGFFNTRDFCFFMDLLTYRSYLYDQIRTVKLTESIRRIEVVV